MVYGLKKLDPVPLPGHSDDNLGVLVEKTGCYLLACVYALPYIVDGMQMIAVTSLKGSEDGP
jgi:hypothetical protein